MPALFLGHGSPMNVLEDNAFTRAWEQLGNTLPRPRAILCISAHWETQGPWVTAMPRPRTIHDFGNFPQALFDVQYPAPGDPDLARRIQSLAPAAKISLDLDWGLDHGTWGLLARIFPQADIPVLQLSLPVEWPPEQHYAMGRALRPLRDEGVWILGSGNIAHNLGYFSMGGEEIEPFGWALEFDEAVRDRLLAGDHRALVEYEAMGDIARRSAPTPEHFLPLLYVIAQQEEGEAVSFPVEGIVYRAISMRGVLVQ